MTSAASGILSEIVAHKHTEVAALRPHAALLEREAYEHASAKRPFQEALRSANPAVIAELKKASPSKGLLAGDYHPAFIAHAYELGGAACISVLTDAPYFQGSLHDLEAARAAVTLPALRKDFIIDRLQIFEAGARGADAILLIAAILDTHELSSYRELAASLGMAALVEVHNAAEVEKAVDSGADIIGVNNRDLETFRVDVDTSVRLSYLLPSDCIRVSESGIADRQTVELLAKAGYSAFLVGESLMKHSDPAACLRSLIGPS